MKKLFAIILSLGLIISPIPVVNTAHAAGAGGYAKIVLGMANGIIGTTILLKCKMGASQPSLLLYMGGSLAYMAGEILAGKTKAKDTKENAAAMDELKANMKEGGDYQRASIDMQIKNEEDNLKHIKKKRMFMMASKVMYTAAAAIAIIEFIMSLSPPVGILKPDMGACAPGVEHEPISQLIIVAYTALTAYSSMGLMGGVAVGAAYALKMKSLLAIGTKVVNMAVTALNSAIGRAAVFTAAAILIMVIDAELKKEQERSEKIIADLKKVRDQFQDADNNLNEGESTSGSGTASGSLAGNSNDPSKRKYNVTALAKGTELAKHCYTQTSSGIDYSESGCKNPLRLQRPTFDGKFEVGSLTAASNQGMDMAQQIADGNIAGAEATAAGLASMAGKVDAAHKDLMKKINDKLKAEGKKPIDVDGELKRQVASLNAEMNKQNPGSGNFSVADLTDGGDAATSDIANADDLKGQEITGASTAAAIAIPESGIDLSKIGEGDVAAVDPNAEKVASLEDSLGQYESNESDISKDPGVSIFKQVSNRYILNYEKIFNRKQINPPMAEPEPTNP